MKDDDVVLNRAARRKLSKKFHIKEKPMERVNKGDCYYCQEPVLIAEGQLYTLFRGKPSHKACRLSPTR